MCLVLSRGFFSRTSLLDGARRVRDSVPGSVFMRSLSPDIRLKDSRALSNLAFLPLVLVGHCGRAE